MNISSEVRESETRKLDELYIINNVDGLEQWQKNELMGFIARLNSGCLKQNADGVRINISILSPYILRRIKLYISNQTEYNSFFI